MRIAVSGTHFMGKSTLIADFIKKHSDYHVEIEPYYKLQEEKTMEFALEPSLDSLIEQLNYSMNQLNDCANKENVIFDRCPIDYLAYALCALEQEDGGDVYDSEISELFPEIKEALNCLDLILFLPICAENDIEYTEENPAYRKAADRWFQKFYIELAGDRMTRLKNLEYNLTVDYS